MPESHAANAPPPAAIVAGISAIVASTMFAAGTASAPRAGLTTYDEGIEMPSSAAQTSAQRGTSALSVKHEKIKSVVGKVMSGEITFA